MNSPLLKLESSDFGLKLANSKFVNLILPATVFLTLSVCLYLVFVVVPSERVMGAVQRIFYFHVGSAMATYLAIAILFVSSVFYLVRRIDCWDMLAHSAALVALLFSTQVLATGMIWGHSAWNVWWRWEPRLVSFLVLWLCLIGYCLLRSFASEHLQQRNFSAVLGIITAINIPIVVFSVKLLRASEQLHPQVVANQGLRDPSYVYTLVACILSLSLFAIWLILLALQGRIVEHELVKKFRERG